MLIMSNARICNIPRALPPLLFPHPSSFIPLPSPHYGFILAKKRSKSWKQNTSTKQATNQAAEVMRSPKRRDDTL